MTDSDRVGLTGASTIGGRIAFFRAVRGWTKAELSRQVGCGWRLVHKWETGEQRPDRESVATLAKVLGVTIEEILGVATGQNPPFDAWAEFLSTPQGEALTDGERRMLQSIAWPPGLEPTTTGYVMALAAIRSGTKARK